MAEQGFVGYQKMLTNTVGYQPIAASPGVDSVVFLPGGIITNDIAIIYDNKR